MTKREYINAFAKALSFFINLVISFILTSYIVNTIGEEAYGFVGLGNDFVGYAQIITIAINSMASRYIVIEYEKENYKNANYYLSSLFFSNVVLILLFCIVGGLTIFNLNKLFNVSYALVNDIRVLWVFLFLNFFVNLLNTTFQVSLFYNNRLELDAYNSTIGIFLKSIILLFMFLIFKPNVWYIGFATLVSSIYPFVFNVFYTRKEFPKAKISIGLFRLKKALILFKSGFWNSLTQIGVVLRNGLDLLITNLFVGASAMGVMSVTRVVPQYVLNLFAVVSGIFLPRLMSSYAKSDHKSIKEQMENSISFMAFFSAFPLIVIFTLGEDFYRLWLPTQDAKVLYIITIVSCIIYVFHLPMQPLWNIFSVYNKLKVPSCFLLGEAVLSIMTELVLLQWVKTDFQKMIVIAGVSSFFVTIRTLIFLPIYANHIMKGNLLSLYVIVIKNVGIILGFSGIIYFFKGAFRCDKWGELIIFAILECIIILLIECLFMLKSNVRNKIFEITKGKIKWKR